MFNCSCTVFEHITVFLLHCFLSAANMAALLYLKSLLFTSLYVSLTGNSIHIFCKVISEIMVTKNVTKLMFFSTKMVEFLYLLELR